MAQHFPNSGRLGVPELDQVQTTASVPLGTIVTGYNDETDTEGEYIYIKANAAIAIGEIGYIDLTNEVVLADSDVHANDGGPVGFAVAALATDEYGWLQISGKVKAATAADAAAGAKVFLTATAGTVDDSAIAGCQVLGAEFDTTENTPADGFTYISCNRPHVQGQDAVT